MGLILIVVGCSMLGLQALRGGSWNTALVRVAAIVIVVGLGLALIGR
jgi:hypothetical protein